MALSVSWTVETRSHLGEVFDVLNGSIRTARMHSKGENGVVIKSWGLTYEAKDVEITNLLKYGLDR